MPSSTSQCRGEHSSIIAALTRIGLNGRERPHHEETNARGTHRHSPHHASSASRSESHVALIAAPAAQSSAVTVAAFRLGLRAAMSHRRDRHTTRQQPALAECGSEQAIAPAIERAADCSETGSRASPSSIAHAHLGHDHDVSTA